MEHETDFSWSQYNNYNKYNLLIGTMIRISYMKITLKRKNVNCHIVYMSIDQ